MAKKNVLQVRVAEEDQERWQAAADREGMKLSAWVIYQLNIGSGKKPDLARQVPYTPGIDVTVEPVTGAHASDTGGGPRKMGWWPLSKPPCYERKHLPGCDCYMCHPPR